MKVNRSRAVFLIAALALCILVSGIARLLYTRRPRTEVKTVPALAVSGVSRQGETMLLARLITAEANLEPYEGKVGVGAVVLNRVATPGFPKTIPGVIFEPWAFESVESGLIWNVEVSEENLQAATAAMNGWDPTYGATFFWNPYKPVSPWIWTRQIITQIGNHVFAR